MNNNQAKNNNPLNEQAKASLRGEAPQEHGVKGKNVNTMLHSIHGAAMRIVSNAGKTGEVDYSDSESLFESMKEVSLLPCDLHGLGIEYFKLYKFCQLTRDIEDICDTEGMDGFSSDWEDLARMVANSCPELVRFENVVCAVKQLGAGSAAMPTDDRTNFMKAIADVLEGYDLMGEEAVMHIFNQ